MDLSLGFLFCSIDLCFCLCASTTLSWWLWLCSTDWSRAGWFLQFHSSFLRLLWLFEVFSISIHICRLFNIGHSDWCKMISHCINNFDLHFSDNLWCWASFIFSSFIFSSAYLPYVCLLWRNIYLGLLPIFQLGCVLLLGCALYEVFVYFGN